MSDLLKEIKEYLDSIRHNAVNMAIARSSDEYNACTKIVFDCEDAVLSLFRKLDREYWKLWEQFEQAQVKIERCKEIFKDIREASSDIYALRKAEQALQVLGGREKVSKEHIVWLISQAEKVERLEQEIEDLKLQKRPTYVTIEGTAEDVHKDLKKFIVENDELKQEVDRLKEQLQQAQAKAERYEKALKEIAEWSGIASREYRIATKALEDEK